MCMCGWAAMCSGVRGSFSGTVPAKDAKQQMEYHCFLLPENQ